MTITRPFKTNKVDSSGFGQGPAESSIDNSNELSASRGSRFDYLRFRLFIVESVLLLRTKLSGRLLSFCLNNLTESADCIMRAHLPGPSAVYWPLDHSHMPVQSFNLYSVL